MASPAVDEVGDIVANMNRVDVETEWFLQFQIGDLSRQLFNLQLRVAIRLVLAGEGDAIDRRPDIVPFAVRWLRVWENEGAALVSLFSGPECLANPPLGFRTESLQIAQSNGCHAVTQQRDN